jgi:catechol 2,3-dioxygenase-like lactoylglutathione lyase family enzyme
MQVKFVSINVDEQSKALDFYTKVLGFTKMGDFTNGDCRWLTVVSADGIEGVELILESLALPPAKERV